jgi:hypothetical protein
MNFPEDFLKHAAECERTAKFARDPKSKAEWRQLADRWRRCATTFSRNVEAPNLSRKREGKSAAG